MTAYNEARARVLSKLYRVPDSDAVTLDKTDVRALLDEVSHPEPEHDSQCEAEYIAEAPGWTECGCTDRRPEPETPIPTVEEYRARLEAIGALQIVKGYDYAHDDAHGIGHILNWAIDYARRRRSDDSAAMVLASLEYVERPCPKAPCGLVDGMCPARGARDADPV